MSAPDNNAIDGAAALKQRLDKLFSDVERIAREYAADVSDVPDMTPADAAPRRIPGVSDAQIDMIKQAFVEQMASEIQNVAGGKYA